MYVYLCVYKDVGFVFCIKYSTNAFFSHKYTFSLEYDSLLYSDYIVRLERTPFLKLSSY